MGETFDKLRSMNLRYPTRCKECERKKKRYQRMKRVLDDIWEYYFQLPGSIYKRPKILTFGLPSSPTERSDSSVELKALKKKMPEAIKILRHHGIKGGIYVTECTTRLVPLEEGFMHFKHHAHIHMVCVAPFKKKNQLSQLNNCLMPIGLGYVYFEAVREKKTKDAKKHVAGYIAKYLSKEGHRKTRFGCIKGLTRNNHSSEVVDLWIQTLNQIENKS